MKLYKNEKGQTLYPICSWENNQHKLYNASDRLHNALSDAVEQKDTDAENEALRGLEKLEKAMEAFEAHVIGGIVYSTWADRQLIMDYIWAYNARH